MLLGRDENRTERCAYYIPVLETLKGMLESGFWQSLMSVDSNDVFKTDVLSDSCDGKVFMSNTFFQENPSCLKLVLYQDASLPPKPPMYDQMLTTCSWFYCVERRILRNLAMPRFLSELLTYLKQLEVNGITMGDELVVKGALYCIAGTTWDLTPLVVLQKISVHLSTSADIV